MLNCSVNHLVGKTLGSAGFNLCNVLEGSTRCCCRGNRTRYLEPDCPFRLNLTQSSFYQILLPSEMEYKSLLKGWTLL